MSTETPTFEPGCVFSPGVVTCGPGGVTIRQRGKCWGLCAKDDARLVVRHPNSPYWGTDTDCECGDSWNEDVCPRPFERGWRKRAQTRFEAAWEVALPEGTTPTRENGKDADGWLSGVRLPDGTEVLR